jgi:hypothetical protein
MLLGKADEALAQQFRAAGFAPEEAVGRARIAAATMHSIALRARAGAPKGDLHQIGDTAVRLLTG